MAYSVTIGDSVEYLEKISRTLDYSLLFLTSTLPVTPHWLNKALQTLHHSRDLIELATCAKEILSEKDPKAKNFVGSKLILCSAIFTPLAIAHEWLALPLAGWETKVEQVGKWTMAIGHGISAFEEEGAARWDMAREAIFFMMEAALLDRLSPLPQFIIGAGSGLWQCYRISC